MKKKVYLSIILSILTLNCRSERSQCYKNNKFDTYNDDSCAWSAGGYGTAEISRSRNRDQSIIDQNLRIGDAYLILCIDNQIKRKRCDKKSDINPAIW